MANGVFEQSLLLEPGAGPSVQHGHEVRTTPFELVEQQVGEQVMVTIPPTIFVERNDEQIGTGELIQKLPGALPTNYLITKRTRHLAQHRSLEHERPLCLWEAGENLFSQQIEYVPVAASERSDKAVRIFLAFHGEHSQVHSRRPPLCAVEQYGEVIRADVKPHLLVQQMRGFPIFSFSRCAVSSSVKASCSVRISLSAPLALNRPRCRGGSERVARTRWTLSGRCSTKKSIDSRHSSLVANW